ncbi:hypothetical protein WG66_005666 [Moniliophthora roreri]|nr:hypothetical protein WG66_005666 [Moniliophthora roreri]
MANAAISIYCLRNEEEYQEFYTAFEDHKSSQHPTRIQAISLLKRYELDTSFLRMEVKRCYQSRQPYKPVLWQFNIATAFIYILEHDADVSQFKQRLVTAGNSSVTS